MVPEKKAEEALSREGGYSFSGNRALQKLTEATVDGDKLYPARGVCV